MKQLSYAFSAQFPAALLPPARKALERACRDWEESGVVRFSEVTSDADVFILFAPMEASLMESGKVSRAPMAYDHARDAILVNSLYSWQTSAWQFWRLPFTPADFAHELGHAMGLPHTRHDFSCMRQGGGLNPQWYDFQFLRASINREARTV